MVLADVVLLALPVPLTLVLADVVAKGEEEPLELEDSVAALDEVGCPDPEGELLALALCVALTVALHVKDAIADSDGLPLGVPL